MDKKIFEHIQGLPLEDSLKIELAVLVQSHVEEVLADHKLPLLLPIKQASVYIGVGSKTIREWTYHKDFPKNKIGTKRLVRRRDVEAWLAKHAEENLGV